MDDLATVPPLGPTTLGLFVVLGALIAILTRTRPLLALAALAFAIPFTFAHRLGATTVDAPKVTLLGAAAVLLVASPRDLLPTSCAARVVAALALGVALLDAARVPVAVARGPAIRETLKAFEYLAVFVVAGALVRRAGRLAAPAVGERWSATLAALAGTVAGLAIVGLAQQRGSVFVVDGHLVRRAAGALEGPNQLAGYLDLLLPPLLAALLARPTPDHRPRAALAFVVAVLAEIATFSRAGIVAAVLGCVVVAISSGAFAPGRRRAEGVRARLGAFGVALALGGAAVGIALRGGAPSGERLDGLATRGELWHAALVLWHRAPVFGIGPGGFEFSLDSVGLLGVRTHANNWYLQTLAENGVVGLALALALLAAIVVGLVRARANGWVATGALGATLALALHQTLDDLVFFPKVGSTWWLLLGVAFALAYTGEAARTRASSASASSSTARV